MTRGQIRLIADKIGAIDEATKALKVERAALVEQLLDRPAGPVEGFTHVLTIVEKIDWRLKTADVKQEMGEAWYLARCKTVSSRSIRSRVL